MAAICQAKNILEIGTLAGYSTIWLARALPTGGKLTTIEYDSQNARIAQNNIEKAYLTSVVKIKVGKALDILPEMEKAGSLL